MAKSLHGSSPPLHGSSPPLHALADKFPNSREEAALRAAPRMQLRFDCPADMDTD